MDIKSKYREKGIESFKTEFNLFLFKHTISGRINDMKPEELLAEFEKNEISQEIRVTYISKYWAAYTERQKIGGLTIKQITDIMKPWQETDKGKANLEKLALVKKLSERFFENHFKSVFPYEDFERMCKDAKECAYCHINKDAVQELIEKGRLYKKHPTRSWEFEIDRKFPNIEYSDENCVICCYWCNNAKTDEFNYYEFMPIGKEIQKVWEARLGRRIIN